jgi:hypothetical protein
MKGFFLGYSNFMILVILVSFFNGCSQVGLDIRVFEVLGVTQVPVWWPERGHEIPIMDLLFL